MSRPQKRKLWSCDTCGVTFVSNHEEGVHVKWEKHGGGIRRTQISVSTTGECPGCGTESPSVTPIIPQS